MIVFDLKCGGAHVFEAWFASSATYEAQRDDGAIACPVCGDTAVAKAVMAPRVAGKGNARGDLAPARAKRALQALAAAQAKALEGSTWVGSRFAAEARAMHAGERDHATIHGQATRAEAKALVDDGVPVAALPLPIRAPGTLN